MIIDLFIGLVVAILTSIFSWLPAITTLPTINGFDIDTALVNGIGQFNTFINAFWPIKDMFYGFLALLAYFSIKVIAKAFLGSRAPGHN